ncbi:hypothetical protein HYV58_00235 [Candidatus Peregrinibacteria bacterium]|nr:hypothetical protein [Candidatus Peregrinibacteria bacterium]
MPSYHYIALNPEQKELAGMIEAEDEATARKYLNELGISIISINPADSAAPKKNSATATGGTVYEFEARDKTGKKVVGTIASETPIKAFAKLAEEYQLDVLFLFPSSLSPEEKETSKKNGIAELENEYKKLYTSSVKEKNAEDTGAAAQEQRRELMGKVEFTTTRMEDFLKRYGAELKGEEREVLQSYLNQLMRIKDSTNLDHIRTTVEKMLEHIQKQELFINEEQRLKESAELKVDSKEMLTNLKKTGLQRDIDVIKTAEAIRGNRYLKPIGELLVRWLKPKNPEVLGIKQEMQSVNKHLFAYVKLFLFGPTKVMKREALQSIRTLWNEKKRLAIKLSVLKTEEKKRNITEQKAGPLEDRIAAVSGWVLAFYLASYAITYPFSMKNFGLSEMPSSVFFYRSPLTSAFTMGFFFLYAAAAGRNYWLPPKSIGRSFVFPSALFLFLLFAVNFL